MQIDARSLPAGCPARRSPFSQRRLLWICSLTLLAGACATGGLPDDPVLKEYEPKRWVGTPKSGLRIIVQEDHSAPLVSIAASYGVGATSDPKGVEGLAHFVEHLVFRSKPFGGELGYWDLLKRAGGSFNATTSWDFTNYFTTAHKSNLKLLLQLEAWRLSHAVDGVTPGVFATEREVVRNELRQRWETTVNNKMFDLVFAQLYPEGHPMRRPVGGTHESLTAAKLEHAQAFVKEHYRPDNCTLVIVGDVDTEEVKKLIGTWPVEVLFGPGGPDGPAVPPRKRVAERQAPPVPAPVDTSLARHKGPIPAPVLILAWSLPPGYRGKDAVADFASSRLDLALGELDYREEDDIIGAGAFTWTFGDSSVMFMTASLRPWADPEKARRRLLDVLVHSWSTEFGRIQTEASRWFGATGLLQAASNPLQTAQTLAEFMAATGKTTYFKEHFDELAAIKTSEVTDFAHQWLTRERAVAVYFEPDTNQAPTVMGAAGGSAGGAAPGSGGQHEIARGLLSDVSALTSERLRTVVKSPGLASAPRFTMSNGLPVYVLSRPDMPTARIQLALHGGNASTRPVGAASLARNLSRSQCDRYKGLAAVGGSMGGGLDLTAGRLTVTVLSGNLANGLAALHDEVNCMEVSEEIFLHLPRLLKQSSRIFEQTSKRPEFVAGKWLSGQLYPDHPFGEAGFLDPAVMAGLRREDAQAFVSSHFRPDNGVAVIYGGITLDEARAESEKYLGNWKGGGGASMAPPPAPPGPTERRLNLVNRPGATQAIVSIGCRLQPMTADRYPAYEVLSGVASESAWILREQWGATYGIGAFVDHEDDNSAHLTFGGAIENSQAGKAVTRLLQMIGVIGRGEVAEPLFLTKRWDVGREFMMELATLGSQATAITHAWRHGWSLDVWDKYPDNLAATTRETLKEIMTPCLGKEVVAIVGDTAVLKPQLEAEGLKVQ